MRRRICCGFLPALIVALLAGCGGGRGTPTATSTSPTTTVTTVAAVSPTASPTAALTTRTATFVSASSTARTAATPSIAATTRLTVIVNSAQVDTTTSAAGGVVIYVSVRNETSGAMLLRISDFRVRDSGGYIYRPNEQWSATATTSNGGIELKNGELRLDAREVSPLVLWVPEAHRGSGLQLTYQPDPSIAVSFTPRLGTP